ncbi:MAG: pimeloyl-ACP methyl ester carboxylesterase [Psychromonas sp.]
MKNLVLIHGFLESNTMWDYLNLEKHFNCFRFELPGHGKAKYKPNTTINLSEVALDFNKWLAKNNIEYFDILGHSMGGYVALEMSKNKGFKGKVILLNSNFWCDSAQKKKDRERVANIVVENKKLLIETAIPNLFSDKNKYQDEIDSLIQEATSIRADAIAAASISMKNRQDHSETVRQLSYRLLFVQGELDKIMPKSVSIKQIGNMEIAYECISNAGHMCHVEATNETQQVIIDFLN